MLYWAYGSNLCKAAMARRCPRARPFDVLTVPDGALVFRSVADVVSRPGSSVPGGLWEITRRCEAALDRYEGVASDYYLKKYFRLQVNGRERRCLYYIMNPIYRGVAPPSEGYLETIIEGYNDFGLDTAALNTAVEESWSNKRITRQVRESRARRGGRAARLGDYFSRNNPP